MSLNGLDVVTNANGDYSVTPGSFRLICPADSQIVIERMMIGIVDGTISDSEDYGQIVGGLTNGVRIYVRDTDGDLIEELTPIPAKSNGDWGLICKDADPLNYGNGDDYLPIRWTFAKSGKPVVLNPGWYLEAYLNDDLTGLIRHLFLPQGYYSDKVSEETI